MADGTSIGACFHLLVAMSFLVESVTGQNVVCPSDWTGNTDNNKDTGVVTWSIPRQPSEVMNTACTPQSGSEFPIGITVVTCSAQTTAGDRVTCTFRVTVSDNQNPTITKCPEAVRKTIPDFDPMNPVFSVPVSWDQPATDDNSNKPLRTSFTHVPGTKFDLGITTVRYTTRDSAGNEASCSFNIRAVVQPPVNHTLFRSVTSERFTVVWPQSENAAIADYSLLVWANGTPRPDSSQRVPVTLSSDQMKYTYVEQAVTSLEPGTLYNVEVSSESGAVVSSTQQWTRPTVPAGLTSTTLSPTSAELTWTAPSSGNVEQYRVTVGVREPVYVPREMSRVILESLRPGESLLTRVSAVVGSGKMRQEADSSVTVSTGPLNASQLVAYNYTESTIALVWATSPPSSNEEPYMLLINPADAEKSYLTVSDTGNIASAEFKGLKPNTDYMIRLISNSGLSVGTSQKTRPGRVSNIRPTVVTNDSITLVWDAPTEDEVTSYMVTVSPAGTAEDPNTMLDTSRIFVNLEYATEYFFSVVSVHDGIESVPQTLMVTPGVTQAVTEPLNMVAIVVGVVLGTFVLILAIIFCCTFWKYRRLQGSEKLSSARTGRTNAALETDDHTYKSERRVTDTDSGEIYELPNDPSKASGPKQFSNPSTEYENAVIRPITGKTPPPVQNKPKFGRR
ncbi:fibronectin-like [Acanthaster planci]|uniref:Fibronectin-like n=1 Tax=Acanthaster planci TaxID=133434 RepID=A0A8B8A718_ACAPL|nr:fibronectin-like [Acanthaster planci]XP_022111808.1 fibronectin-like [Acanthaster planci]XP_022111809.1 fibronectin-like [Acanthaster planci]XP_022111810.1 fibronectin-like [Acanthaster planci]XP_022111811.1 fibronectin-like [Acanthaster planci]